MGDGQALLGTIRAQPQQDLRISCLQRRNQDSALGQLRQQDVGHLIDRARKQDPVIGAAFRPPGETVAMPDGHIAESEVEHAPPGRVAQAAKTVHGEHIGAELGGERGRIAAANANQQDACFTHLLDPEGLQQLAGHGRARHDLATRDGQDTVFKGEFVETRCIHERAPVDRLHRFQHAVIGNALLPQVQDKARGAERISNQVGHVSRSSLR